MFWCNSCGALLLLLLLLLLVSETLIIPAYLSGLCPVTTLSSLTMLGCRAACKIDSSLTLVTGSPSLPRSKRTFLSATICPVGMWRAGGGAGG
jgi:hypothetical protein